MTSLGGIMYWCVTILALISICLFRVWLCLKLKELIFIVFQSFWYTCLLMWYETWKFEWTANLWKGNSFSFRFLLMISGSQMPWNYHQKLVPFLEVGCGFLVRAKMILALLLRAKPYHHPVTFLTVWSPWY